MIISKTPLRMSFLGGGTDLPDFYRRHGGLVVSTSIDKYVFVTVNEKFDDRIRVGYTITEHVDSIEEIKHPIVREAMRFKSIVNGIEITSMADVPASGTGLGSSSSFTVGLLHALSALRGEYCSADALAKDACTIEIDICREPIGKQDQFAAAFGGLNMFEFRPDDSVKVTPVLCKQDYLRDFENQLVCFYTGRSRSASDLLRKQSERARDNTAIVAAMNQMKQLALDFVTHIYSGDTRAIGEILHEGWMLKRSLSEGISDGVIDQYYDLARREGAYGGKLLGAGGGGFLMFQAPPDRHDAIKNALSDLRPFKMPFSDEGSRIIFYHPNRS